MGANSQIGNFYLLRLALESVPPITHTNASEVGNSVYIVVRDGAAVRGQTTYIFLNAVTSSALTLALRAATPMAMGCRTHGRSQILEASARTRTRSMPMAKPR